MGGVLTVERVDGRGSNSGMDVRKTGTNWKGWTGERF